MSTFLSLIIVGGFFVYFRLSQIGPLSIAGHTFTALQAACVIVVACFSLVYFVIRKARRSLKEALQQRIVRLTEKYGEQSTKLILAGQIWVGMSEEELVESKGQPEAIETQIMATRNRRIFKYDEVGENRYQTRITVDDGIVKAWKMPH